MMSSAAAVVPPQARSATTANAKHARSLANAVAVFPGDRREVISAGEPVVSPPCNTAAFGRAGASVLRRDTTPCSSTREARRGAIPLQICIFRSPLASREHRPVKFIRQPDVGVAWIAGTSRSTRLTVRASQEINLPLEPDREHLLGSLGLEPKDHPEEVITQPPQVAVRPPHQQI